MRLGSGLLRVTVAVVAMGAFLFNAQSVAQAPNVGDAGNPVAIDDEEEIVDHWVIPRDQVRSQTETYEFASEPMIVLSVVVAPDGRVVSAEPIEGPVEFFQQAIEMARSWRYKPFEREGRPVYAKIVDHAFVESRERWAETRVPFPAIRRWNSLRITFDHTYCYRTCAIYSVQISGDGTVVYEGQGVVAVGGKHQSRVSPETVRGLFDAFRAAEYFSALDEYVYESALHFATNTTSIAFDGVRKSVKNYGGISVGLPTAVSNLEYAIGEVAGTDKWLQITPQSIPSLIAEGYFRRRERNASILANMIQASASADIVRELIALGASVNATGDYAEGRRRGTPLMAAAERGDAGIVEILLAAGAARNDRMQISMALSTSALSGSTELVRLFLARGADPNVRDRENAGATPLMYAAVKGSPDIVSALLSAGANPNIKDEHGRSLLDYSAGGVINSDDGSEEAKVRREETIRLLLQAGADPNTCSNARACTTARQLMSRQTRPPGP